MTQKSTYFSICPPDEIEEVRDRNAQKRRREEDPVLTLIATTETTGRQHDSDSMFSCDDEIWWNMTKTPAQKRKFRKATNNVRRAVDLLQNLALTPEAIKNSGLATALANHCSQIEESSEPRKPCSNVTCQQYTASWTGFCNEHPCLYKTCERPSFHLSMCRLHYNLYKRVMKPIVKSEMN